MIVDFVAAASAADLDAAAACVSADAQFKLPGGRILPPGAEGARAFAAQHGEADGRKPTVELLTASACGGGSYLVSLRFVSREVATGETMYEMIVGGIITVDRDRVVALRAFPSVEEAEAAL